jgi:hypothetical protein
MTLFHRGEAVTLTPKFAETLARNPKTRVDWKSRRGIVHRCNGHSVYVVWNGCSSKETLPVKAVTREL